MNYQGGLSVDPALMRQLGDDTRINAQQYWEELSSLRNNVESLIGIWHGNAADAFNNAYNSQNEIFSEFEARLEELGRVIMVNSSEFAETEGHLTAEGANLFNN